MDGDVDMDAPQISTLPQAEATPPPSKLRVKLLVGDKKGKAKSSPPSAPTAARKSAPRNQSQSQPQSEEEADEEDEEDQLIDDDAPAPSVSAGTKRKAPTKKSTRPRKADKQDKEDKKPDEPREPPDGDAQSVSAPPLPDKPPPKKKAAPRRAATASKPKIKVPPNARGTKTLTVPPVEDAAMSETHTITAPSSPLPMSVSRAPSPELEVEQPPPLPPPPEQPEESMPLPLPLYPLPSKPFPVQPPPKIGTGFAPVQPLDRNGAKVRPWRIANREIRGIAGGRWLTRSWVGEKESDFASAVAAASAATTAKVADSDKVALPKSISASGKAGKSKAVRGSAASAGISAAPSRSGSIVQELHTPKAPTKMRNIITGPASEAGDEPEHFPEPRSVSTMS